MLASRCVSFVSACTKALHAEQESEARVLRGPREEDASGAVVGARAGAPPEATRGAPGKDPARPALLGYDLEGDLALELCGCVREEVLCERTQRLVVIHE